MAQEYSAQDYYNQNPEALGQNSNASDWQTWIRTGLMGVLFGFKLIYKVIWEFFWRWWK